MILGNIGTTGTSIAQDFDALSTILSDRSATFLIFAVDETPEPGFPRSFVLFHGFLICVRSARKC